MFLNLTVVNEMHSLIGRLKEDLSGEYRAGPGESFPRSSTSYSLKNLGFILLKLKPKLLSLFVFIR